ncbi:adenylate/guanylate cyclase domain-containing protein [Mycobacterium sp. 1164985.4]|uniref:adenylate/guanylate cyclase domain-containing protein n=1 Tax=Mycobacterium sp. 1164985.4 TaxID=1834069 RepID=UPI0007FF6AB4|nr:adenylate/guanylate cyclase domain-containing protein [Mycobacterium sp. 1164985.4]OBK76342.1 hypothetical protein A5650_15575 [Mycobacterium sp. 1164985.4]
MKQQSPPCGTATFLLTDLEGSTRMWEQDPTAMKAAMDRHDEILEKAIAAQRGYVFAKMGDGMAAAFATARDAVAAAATIQHALADETWVTPVPLRARMGLHTDEAIVVNDNNYASQPVNRCSRLMAAAHGGQVVLSASTETLVRNQLPDGAGLIDLGEHRLRDLGSPTRVFQLTLDGLGQEFPPLRSLATFPSNLPAQVSSFIGREADVARVIRALTDSRVVTITGVGGVGKTRLAIQVAAELLPHYREGAWLLELAPVTDPPGVAEAISQVFQPSNRGGQSLDDVLIETLSQKHLLLVLDNCEHVLSSVAQIAARIETSCPGVDILATSREGMAIDGEQLIALPPLATGEPHADIESLLRTDAARLFVDRARRVKSDFVLNEHNARAVVEICQRLDGVPLAIELAAARVIALTPADLLQRLDRRFELLAGGRRGAVGRHATLRAAIDWSFALLDPDEQRLLARMAVFSGGFTLEAIEDVCSGGPVQPQAVLDLVTSLVTKSLVVAEEHEAGTRYRLLETLRQYSEEWLAEFDEIGTTRGRHSRFYAELLTQAAHDIASERGWFSGLGNWTRGVGQRQVGLERDNIRSALANAIAANDVGHAVQIVANHPHRHRANANRIGQMWSVPASEVIAIPGAAEHPEFPRVLMVAAYEALDSGDPRRAAVYCRQALDSAQYVVLEGPPLAIDAYTLRAEESLARGSYTEAVQAYSQAAELAEANGYPGIAAIFLAYSVSSALLGSMDSDAATARAERAMVLARRSDMPGATVIALNALALSLVDTDPERSRALLDESAQRCSSPSQEIAPGFITASLVAGRLRDWPLTLSLAGRAMYMYRGIMNPMHSAPCLAECARALAETRPDVAAVLQSAAYSAFRNASFFESAKMPSTASKTTGGNFVFQALRETGEIVAAALGPVRARELRGMGSVMGLDEAVSFALTNIDPVLLAGPIATIDR